MRVLISEFRQETNSFSPLASDAVFWENSGWILSPERVRGWHEGSGSAIDGMLSELASTAGLAESAGTNSIADSDEPTIEVDFGPAYYAQSGGTAPQELMDRYTSELFAVLAADRHYDALLFSFHGALQTNEFDDAEAEVLRRVRAVVGEETTIGVSTDLHGYISARFVEQADIICGYQTYPHTDFFDTGARAARLALRLLNDAAVPPAAVWVPVPMIVPASGYNSLGGPFAEVLSRGQDLISRGDILDFSVYQMQPWLDVEEPNSTVIVIADDHEAAAQYAEELAAKLYAARGDMWPHLSSIDDAIDLAANVDTSKPVLLVDAADSTNAGAAGDSMAVAAHLLQREQPPRSAVVVADRPAVQRAHQLGVGATAEFTIGGSVTPDAQRITAEGYVRSLHDGNFQPERPGHTGDVVSVGRAAVITFGRVDVMVCENIAGNGDPQLYRAFGLEPTMYDVIVIKANTSFRAGYQQIGGTVVPTDTPGSASSNIAYLPFTRMPPVIYPWRDDYFRPRAVPLRHTASS